jgi:hypothetical protein
MERERSWGLGMGARLALPSSCLPPHASTAWHFHCTHGRKFAPGIQLNAIQIWAGLKSKQPIDSHARALLCAGGMLPPLPFCVYKPRTSPPACRRALAGRATPKGAVCQHAPGDNPGLHPAPPSGPVLPAGSELSGARRQDSALLLQRLRFACFALLCSAPAWRAPGTVLWRALPSLPRTALVCSRLPCPTPWVSHRYACAWHGGLCKAKCQPGFLSGVGCGGGASWAGQLGWGACSKHA